MMFFDTAISSSDIINMAVNTMNKIGKNLFQSCNDEDNDNEEKELDQIDTSKKNNNEIQTN